MTAETSAPVGDRPAKPRPLARLSILGQGSPTHRLESRPLTVGERRYRLFRAVPAAAGAGGRPILYMLDGNGAFDFLTPVLLAAVPDLVIAGIGYETPYRFDTVSRVLDYSPAWPGTGPRPDPERPERSIGGADPFLDRLLGPIRQAAEDGMAVDPGRRAIWGHSMAGLLALYALLSRPAAFRRFAAISPSVWWGDAMLLGFDGQSGETQPGAERRELLVMLSDSERRSSQAGPHWDGPAPHTLEIVRRLSARQDVAVDLRILSGLPHAETLPASLEPALRFAASG